MAVHTQRLTTMDKKKSVGFPAQPSLAIERIPTRIRAPPLIVSKLTTAQRMRREKTFTSAKTAIAKALETTYDDLVEVPLSSVEEVLTTAEDFIHAIKYRINKNRHSLKFHEPFLGGETVTATVTKSSYKTLKLYMPLNFKDVRPRNAITGYTSIYMSRNPSYDRYQSIRTDGNRNLVSPLKVSKAVHEILTHICQSTGRGEVLPFHSNTSDYGEGNHQTVILLGDIRLTAVPCISPKVAKRDEDGTLFVAVPYLFDEDPASDQLWR